MRVRFWGTRGSIATPGPTTVRYGGNTSCIELLTRAGERFIFDCGTGIRSLGLELLDSPQRPIRATILLGHTHWDHIQGFPFFMPAFESGNEFTICAPKGIERSLSDVLAGQMEYTYFPVELNQLPAGIEFRELDEGVFQFGTARVFAQYMNHPAPALAYRVEADGVNVVYMCDHEPFGDRLWREGSFPGELESLLHEGDRRHADFMRHADLLIHDSQYTPEEYPQKKNWGHSSYEYPVELAAMSDVYRVVLTHHDPTHNDDFLDEVQRRARHLARQRNFMMQVMCAYEGMEIHVVAPASDRLRSIDLRPGTAVIPAKMRALIVDDDPNLRLIAGTALKREGYEISEAADGEEALWVFEHTTADIVILDVNMPHLNGFEFLERFRKTDTRTPVLMLTTETDDDAVKAAFSAGANDYLLKPFTPPQLCARVHACLTRSRASAATA